MPETDREKVNDDDDDDDGESNFIKRMAYLSAAILSGLGFVGYVMRRIYNFYRDTVELQRNYATLIADA